MRSRMAAIFGLAMLLGIGAAANAADEPPASGTVSGVVVDAGGSPVADCIVTATESAQKMRTTHDTTSDKDGKFSLDLPEGKWNLSLRTRDAKLKAVKSADVVADKTIDLGKIELKPKK